MKEGMAEDGALLLLFDGDPSLSLLLLRLLSRLRDFDGDFDGDGDGDGEAADDGAACGAALSEDGASATSPKSLASVRAARSAFRCEELLLRDEGDSSSDEVILQYSFGLFGRSLKNLLCMHPPRYEQNFD